MGVAVAVVLIVAAALSVLVTAAAFARFLDPETWRLESRWARWRRTAASIERLAFAGLNPLRALILWLVLTGVLVAFFALPALFYLLGRIY